MNGRTVPTGCDSPGSVEQELARVGSSAAELEDAFERLGGDRKFLSRMVRCAQNPRLQSGSTWMIKRALERGEAVPDLSDEILQLLPAMDEWQARLHLLQSIRFLRISSRAKEDLRSELLRLVRDGNNFVRAWAYDGLHRLGSQHPEFAEEAEALCRKALESEAPSVKARIRNLAGPKTAKAMA